jgi:hypothetical protein
MFAYFKRKIANIGLRSDHPTRCARESRLMREELSEKQIDKTLMDSFPCSDPPAWF